MKTRNILLILGLLPSFAFGQLYKIQGKISGTNGQPITNATVKLGDKTSITTDKGTYFIEIAKGNYTIGISHLEYKTIRQRIEVGTDLTKDYILESADTQQIETVTVQGKTPLRKLKETPFNVTALDARENYNSTMGVIDLLNTASGIKVREAGGLGSDYNINLNGFTGRQVKIFLDGIPMEGFGSAYNINNIPVTLTDRIEIYKGVVPIELGSDALGGAINIVTRDNMLANNKYADVSVSYGSYNTVKSNVNLGYTGSNGYVIQLSAVQNYSDNDYKVYEVVTNLDNFSVSPQKEWNRRFNDHYRNENLTVKTGLVRKSWADRLLVGITLGQDQKGIQTNFRQRVVYGKREAKGHTIMPSLEYRKSDFLLRNLDLSLTANYNINYNQTIDTSRYWFNWRNESRVSGRSGEAGLRSLNKFYNDNGSAVLGFNYTSNDRKHRFNFHNTFTAFQRRNADPEMIKDPLTGSEEYKRENSKNVTGFSYVFDSQKNWNMIAFGKYYAQWASGPVNISDGSTNATWVLQHRSSNNIGYGLAGTYFLDAFQFKTSYEKSYRMPGSTELFGDGINIDNASSLLRPESSDNINLNISYTTSNTKKTDHRYFAEVGLIYRNTKDFIIQSITGQNVSGLNTSGFARFTNWGNVLTYGANVEARYYYARRLSVGGSLTYQDSRDKQEISGITGRPSLSYNIRVPNIPYFFGNANIEAYFHDVLRKGNMLTLGYGLNFVEQYFFDWENLGTPVFRPVIPRQLSHDANVTYSLQNGRYNIIIEGLNLSNELLYDNFSLQKPGRAFHVKLRYFINKRS